MSSTTTTNTQSQAHSRTAGRGGKRGNRGRGGASRGNARPTPGSKGNHHANTNANPGNNAEGPEIEEKSQAIAAAPKEQAPEADDSAVCWICAEPVKYYSVSACNHRTCHVCALRLRALYKKLDCAFCKEPQPTVIFTVSPDAPFSSYTPESIPHKDSKLSIHFETTDMMEETLILLRFNCPDPECDYTATGWGDLKLHIRASHGKMLCDLCIRFKKVFAHEHALYPPNTLPLHLPSMPHRAHKQPPKEPIEGGIHPLCAFCKECFFSDDELFVHMRERHEECFICKRNEVRDQYFLNYESLEQHFNQAHFACTNAHCQVQKFVVFGSALDLKAHMVEAHGADMSARDKRDARRVEAEFGFDEAGGSGGGNAGGGRRGRRDRDRDREREPPPPPQVQGPAQTPTPQVQTRRRREGFGGHLTGEGDTSATGVQTPVIASSGASRRASPSPGREDADPVIALRQNAFLARLQSLAPNPTAVKAALRSYRASESSARDLISTIWNVLDRNLDDTASLVNAVVDLLEDEEKKTELLAQWNGFKVEQRQAFPDLVPTAVGSGYAGITSGRVLNAKHSTATRSSSQSSRQLWDRVAQAAGSSSASGSARGPVPGSAGWSATGGSANGRTQDQFPALGGSSFPSLSGPPSSTAHGTGTGTVGTTPFRQGPRSTPWASSSSNTTPNTNASAQFRPVSIPAPAAKKVAGKRGAPPPLSNSAFPELPSNAGGRYGGGKPAVGGNQSLKKILGDSAPAVSAWSGGGGNGNGSGSGPGTPDEGDGTAGKGKKGKGKQKQTLFTLGAFPA